MALLADSCMNAYQKKHAKRLGEIEKDITNIIDSLTSKLPQQLMKTLADYCDVFIADGTMKLVVKLVPDDKETTCQLSAPASRGDQIYNVLSLEIKCKAIHLALKYYEKKQISMKLRKAILSLLESLGDKVELSKDNATLEFSYIVRLRDPVL